MLVQLPQNLVLNQSLAQFNDMKVTVLKFPHLPFRQGMQWLRFLNLHIPKQTPEKLFCCVQKVRTFVMSVRVALFCPSEKDAASSTKTQFAFGFGEQD